MHACVWLYYSIDLHITMRWNGGTSSWLVGLSNNSVKTTWKPIFMLDRPTPMVSCASCSHRHRYASNASLMAALHHVGCRCLKGEGKDLVTEAPRSKLEVEMWTGESQLQFSRIICIIFQNKLPGVFYNNTGTSKDQNLMLIRDTLRPIFRWHVPFTSGQIVTPGKVQTDVQLDRWSKVAKLNTPRDTSNMPCWRWLGFPAPASMRHRKLPGCERVFSKRDSW